MLKRKGQSTLEYVIILTAIVAAVILVANKFIGKNVQNSLEHAGNEMETGVKHINFGGAGGE